MDIGAEAGADQPLAATSSQQDIPALRRISLGLARLECAVAGVLLAGVFGVLLANVIGRATGRPLIWADELAVNLMIWAALMGTSIGLAYREHIAVTLVPDMVPAQVQGWLAIWVDLLLLGFFAIFAVLLWQWFDLPGLIAAGGAEAHGAATFNFIWSEPTVTLGLRKVWFWMILPVFCLTGGLHVLASLGQRLARRGALA